MEYACYLLQGEKSLPRRGVQVQGYIARSRSFLTYPSFVLLLPFFPFSPRPFFLGA